MITPKITIVTPSFNRKNYLEDTILSVLSQNYPNLEYIIIDGGSTDGSTEIIKKYENSLSYWCSEPDDGMYDALRKGFSRSSGQIMGWLNSDDLHFPWTLRTIAEVFTKFSEVNWISSLLPTMFNSNGVPYKYGFKKGYAQKYFLNGLYMNVPGRHLLGFIQQESTFWRRGLYEQVGGLQHSYQLAGDFDLWARFFGHSELHGIGCMLGGFRYHGEQLSVQSFDQYLAEAYDSLHSIGGSLCNPLSGWFQLKHMEIMAKWPQIKTPSLGLLQPVHNIAWNKLGNEWKVIGNWI